ncbi:glycoside hydrolase family 2 TIM barrel-domain containing protein [Carboxylicivirga sp. RSCT41]|uniref:glycoside hydrolase family 2 TIM barrel-domain containing protein n=1 Tax=Carboxylicivirga agarovorans TaxID=3417570 RepID=UPI003D329731
MTTYVSKQVSYLLFCISIVLLVGCTDKGVDKVSGAQLFNFGWKFYYGDIAEASKPDFDDSQWRDINLPHDFQIEQDWITKEQDYKLNSKTPGDPRGSAYAPRGFKPIGTGWYRKTFEAPQAWKGKRIFADFEGIMLVGDVWLNGVKIGKTDYGYVGFECNITPYINFDKPNTFAVRASTMEQDNARWYTGGGIYRDVHIVLKETVAIARHGVFITTPEITAENAIVNIQTEIENTELDTKNVVLETKIFAPNGIELGSMLNELNLAQGLKKVMSRFDVKNPELWSCESPTLYTAQVTVKSDKQILDKQTYNFGIRKIEFTPEQGFLLNGEKVLFKGVNMHHDLGALGAAVYDNAIEKRFQLLKEMGCNHIRTAHNPYSESFLDLADKYGFLVVNEAFDKWYTRLTGGRTEFHDLWERELTEFVKRDRNHPSVVLWSLGNELTKHQVLNTCREKDWGVTMFKKMDAVTKKLDPTRKTTVGHYPARANGILFNQKGFTESDAPALAKASDVVSYNYTWEMFEKDGKDYPNMIFYQSEAQTLDLGYNFFGMNLDKVVGLAYWGAIAYLGEGGVWPYKGWGTRAVIDLSLEKKPQFYFIKSYFDDEPVVHISVFEKEAELEKWSDVTLGMHQMSENWNRPEGSNVNLFTYTNADEVELFLNGKSLGVQKNDTSDYKWSGKKVHIGHLKGKGVFKRNRIYWPNIKYQAGTLKAVARKNGQIVAEHQIETYGKPVALKLSIDNENWEADGLDLQHVRVYAVDDKGRTVVHADDMIHFSIAGDATLVAVDNGDITSEELHVDNKRTLYNGSALAIVRAGLKKGTITLRAESKNLKSAEVILELK